MAIGYKIRDERLQYDINREAAKISALYSREMKKQKYTDEEILTCNQKEVIEQPKFAYSSLINCLKNKQKHLKIKEKNK